MGAAASEGANDREMLMTPKVSATIALLRRWSEEVARLKEIAAGLGLTEERKWGWPCYTDEGRNVVLIHGFKDYCALLFFRGALLSDPEGVLVRQTPNVQSARQMRFTSAAEVERLAPVAKALMADAVAVTRSGRKVELKRTRDFASPPEFEERMARDPELSAAFDALTPGRQRAYLLHFAGAKQSATRESRIDKCAPRILAGKGLLD
jgi:uncharacterized protein YdeI (YjbR/CyaY-like superfamily)